jgi:hypothetical protein
LNDNTIVLKAARKSNRKGLTIRKNFQYMDARTALSAHRHHTLSSAGCWAESNLIDETGG